MAKRQWTAVLILGASLISVTTVALATTLSVGAVFGVKALFFAIITILRVITEIATALIAALTSGSTISLSVLVAVWASALTVPATNIQMRVIVAIGVASVSLSVASAVLVIFGVIQMDSEVLGAITCAAAISVSVAAGWAVGVLSLIEKETQKVGLGMTSIFDAVKNNNFRILRILLSFHRETRFREIERALIHAVKANYPECTAALLAHGANADAQDAHGNTALYDAAENGFYKIVKLLLDAGCQVDDRSTGRGTALHQAAKWGHLHCVELLLARGANPDARDGLWRTPLILSAKDAPDALGVMHSLVEAKCNVNMVGVEKKSALHYSCVRGFDISFLLNAKADVNIRDEDGNTALHLAALSGHVNAARSLLTKGCNPNVINDCRRSPLHFSCMKNRLDCALVLVNHGACVNQLDSDGHAPLWFSVVNGHASMVRLLLRANASLDAFLAPIPEQNLLYMTLERGHYLTVKYLVLFGVKTYPLENWLTHRLPAKSLLPSDTFNSVTLDWLKLYISCPPALCQLSRLRIRASLTGKPYPSLFRLPLPKVLQRYIDYKDLTAD